MITITQTYELIIIKHIILGDNFVIVHTTVIETFFEWVN